MSEQEQGQSSGVVGEIVEGLHKLEDKLEHLIHPEPIGDGVTDDTAAIQAKVDAASEAGAAAEGEQLSGSSPHPTESSAAISAGEAGEPSSSPVSGDGGTGEAGNVAQTVGDLASAGSVTASDTASEGNVPAAGLDAANAEAKSSLPASDAASSSASETGAPDLPNDAVSPVASQVADASASSAGYASQSVATQAVSGSVDRRSEVVARLRSIKQQLAVHHFERSVVQGIHDELDAIERLV
jgi:hypothetical protein